MRPSPNHFVQATPVYVFLFILSHFAGAPDEDRCWAVTMQTQTLNPALRAALLFIRYFVAVLMAFLTSYALGFLLLAVHSPDWLLCLVVGFSGVGLGSLYLPRSSRSFGACFLLVLGLGYFYLCWCLGRIDWRLAPLFCGGLIAVIISALRRPNLQPIPR
jgi:hypothetical protein